MGTKTITTNVTLHVPGKNHVPFKFDANGAVTAGHYDIETKLPGTPVELPDDEADRILARHGGEVIGTKADKPATGESDVKPAKPATPK